MPEWKIQIVAGEEAVKARIERILMGRNVPALFFSTAHGLAFTGDHPLQREYQGAIVCRDWSGSRRKVEVEHCFAAPDIGNNVNLHGLIAFLLNCHSAGTPSADDFPPGRWATPASMPSKPFVARLAQRLLSHPKGGALAVVGHIDRAWTSSLGSGYGPGHLHIKFMLRDLTDGLPVGAAMRWMNGRYAELSTELTDALDKLGEPLNEDVDSAAPHHVRLRNLRRATNDARNYVVLGDPAIRLAVKMERLRVCLCYAHEDKVKVRKLFRRLNELNMFEIWFDEENILPGHNLRYEISRAIEESHIVIICLSEIAVTKDGTIHREIRIALDMANEKPEESIFIIPARLEKCRIPERLSRQVYVDIFSEGGVENLVETLRQKAKRLGRSKRSSYSMG